MEIPQVGEGSYFLATRFVVEDRWPDDGPGKAAVSQDRFLAVLVGVNLAQQQWKDNFVEQDAPMAGTVTGTDPGDPYEARHTLCLHGVYERTGRRREQRHVLEWPGWCAERADHGVVALHGFAQHRFVIPCEGSSKLIIVNTRAGSTAMASRRIWSHGSRCSHQLATTFRSISP